MSEIPSVTTELRDKVDDRLGRWIDDIPGLDPEVEALTQRIHMLHRRFERALSEETERFGLAPGEYMVLTMLRGSGPPYTLTPSRLAESCWLSSGAMTNRLDNLEQAGLVERTPSTDDRRSVEVAMTDAGHRLWKQAASSAAAREALIASALDDEEKVELNALLRRLVLAFDRDPA